jgi:hypothetical protein
LTVPTTPFWLLAVVRLRLLPPLRLPPLRLLAFEPELAVGRLRLLEALDERVVFAFAFGLDPLDDRLDWLLLDWRFAGFRLPDADLLALLAITHPSLEDSPCLSIRYPPIAGRNRFDEL